MTAFRLAVLGVMLLFAITADARPPAGGGDPALAPWFQSLTQPGTVASCCDIADCRNADYRLTRDGYEVNISPATFPEAKPFGWRRVPSGALLTRHDNPTGDAVVCVFNNMILCFIPGVEG